MPGAPYIDVPPHRTRTRLARQGIQLSLASAVACALSVVAYVIQGSHSVRYGFLGMLVAAMMAGSGLALVLRCRATRAGTVGSVAIHAAVVTLVVSLAQLPVVGLGLITGPCGTFLSW